MSSLQNVRVKRMFAIEAGNYLLLLKLLFPFLPILILQSIMKEICK